MNKPQTLASLPYSITITVQATSGTCYNAEHLNRWKALLSWKCARHSVSPETIQGE